MVPVEGDSRIVLGIDDKRKDSDFRAQRAQSRVREKRGARLAPLKRPVVRQAFNPGDRDRWIPWQSLRQSLGEVGQWHAACGQDVVAGDGMAHILDCNAARIGTTASVLRGLRSEVPIQRGHTALESGSIVLRPQDLKSEISSHLESRTSRLCV
jgi:hypothetical protein